MWAVVEKSSGRLAGRIGFNRYVEWPEFELAWTLGRPAWGRGYASEGARGALAHAFDVMGRQRVISLIHPKNERSIRVAESIGERLEGTVEFLGFEAQVYSIHREGGA